MRDRSVRFCVFLKTVVTKKRRVIKKKIDLQERTEVTIHKTTDFRFLPRQCRLILPSSSSSCIRLSIRTSLHFFPILSFGYNSFSFFLLPNNFSIYLKKDEQYFWTYHQSLVKKNIESTFHYSETTGFFYLLLK